MQCRHGHDHRTVAEVKQCAAENRSVAPTGPAYTDLLTDRQESYILALMEQVGETDQDLPKPIEGMTKKEASVQITRLLAKKAETPKTENVAVDLKANVVGAQVPQGTYTVVFDAESDDRITLRFRQPKYGKWVGTQLVEHLYGPDNTSDYRRCANWTSDGYRVWNAFAKPPSRVGMGIHHLANASAEKQGEAGYVFSVKSSRCYRCSRKLTVPTSVYRGLGPECASILAGA